MLVALLHLLLSTLWWLQSNGEKGIATCEVVCKGRAGHGSIPKGADNALVKAAGVVQAIEAYWPPTVRRRAVYTLLLYASTHTNDTIIH